ncbi:LuxR family transcriptional regulator [Cypionkella sp.]|uniref:helix-turn-helix transcriptional regulator n=1 Tax=Cypionkella sp. TaxID=2811411 RepID=UPI002633BE55|nr:LuxR family transcriptional regulator [Cypionkella sp.]MDB5665408.1 helix-turn-helix transcriptional regulator [Cypionkella sp.]
MNQAELFTKAGSLVEMIGAKGFPGALADLLRFTVPYSYTVVFGYRDAARPLDLFDDFPVSKQKIFVTDYVEGPYLLDPFFRAAKRPVAQGLYRMRDLAPDRFYQGEYYRNYYAKTGLAEEIGFFIKLAPSTTIVLSLMRAEKAFSARELVGLQNIAPFVIATARKHWGGLPDMTQTSDSGDDKKIENSFASFGQGTLTPREREVVEHTLKGNSAEAISKILGIASGTVRIHRRNVYAKLQISSQGELFSMFIKALSGTAG